MPKKLTLEYDREDMLELIDNARAAEAEDPDVLGLIEWDGSAIGAIDSDGVVLRIHGAITREGLGKMVECYEPDAEGHTAEIVALGSKGMKVKLTEKPAAEVPEAPGQIAE